MTADAAIAQLQRKLQRSSSKRTKEWWEAYMKGVIPFRGLGIPAIRDIVAAWRVETGLSEQTPAAELRLALKLFDGGFAEEKLAGILYLQHHLIDRLPWQALLPRFVLLFRKKRIFDWNTCDWFCVRVLGPMIQRHGLPFARALAEWRRESDLWQARASVVSFVAVARDRQFHPLMHRVCGSLIVREERFAKTAVGWLLRVVSRTEPAFVPAFLGKHYRHFSPESYRNATAYMPRTRVSRFDPATTKVRS